MKNGQWNGLLAFLAIVLLAVTGNGFGCRTKGESPIGDADFGADDPGTDTPQSSDTTGFLDPIQPGDTSQGTDPSVLPDESGSDSGEPVDGTREDPGQANMPPIDCKACNDDEDCRGNYECLPVGESMYCLRRCEDGGDCPSGFLCFASASVGRSCLPVTYSCAACVFDEPCEEGKCCDFATGQCGNCRNLCDGCVYDFDCAKGTRCFKTAGNPVGACVEECANKPCSDPANFTCGPNSSGVMVCQPNGFRCGGCPEGLLPLPDGTGCVECLNSLHCEADAVCNLTTHECEGAECLGGHKCDDGQCHQCCEDAHCGCDGDCGRTGTCLPNYVCMCCTCCNGMCTGEYPRCVEVNGFEQCVQCVEDADCAARDPACTCTGHPLYSCVDGDGNPCPFPERSASRTSKGPAPESAVQGAPRTAGPEEGRPARMPGPGPGRPLASARESPESG